jgi:hypothetical protein
MKSIENKPGILNLLTRTLLILGYIVLLLIPIIMFMVPKWMARYTAKYFLLIFILIPIHWKLCRSGSALRIVLEKLGEDYTEVTTNSVFSERYLKWFYEPFMNFFKLSWNSDNFDRVVSIHFGINIVILWVVCFIYLKRN